MTTSNTSIVHLDPLELLQHGRELAERALNRLSLADQLRTVLAAPPSRREEVLVLSKDAAGLVAAMPIQEWWLTVVQIGAGESLSLIEMATSEQLQFALDVETWRKDRWQPAAILPWLCALFGCGSAKVLTWWRTADPDLLVLMLKRHVTVYMRSGDEEVMDAIAWPRPEPPQTFDNLYYFQCYDTEVERALRPCMDSLAHEDLPRLRHLFDAVLGAVAGEQEEAAYEVRERRLAEEGLPGWDEAIGVYARLRPAQWDGLKRSGPDRLHGAAVPQFGLRPLREQNLFLGEIVERLAPVAVDQLGLELARIANRVMIADGHAIAPMTVAAAARKALGYVNIGLELLSHGDTTAAVQAVHDYWAVTLFQIGFSAVAEMGERARAAWALVATKAEAIPEDPEAAIPYERVRAAMWKWPKYYLGPEAPDGVLHREFMAVVDLAAVEVALCSIS